MPRPPDPDEFWFEIEAKIARNERAQQVNKAKEKYERDQNRCRD